MRPHRRLGAWLRRAALLLSLVGVLGAAPLAARAAEPGPSDFKRYFDAAVRLYRTMDFERSLEQLRLARLQPHSADEDVVASMYEGILRFELGDEAGSASAFRAALFLDREARMPIPVSPRITLMLERERTRLRQKAPITAPQPVPVAVQAKPLSDPPTLQPAAVADPKLQVWEAPPSQRSDAPRPVQVVQAVAAGPQPAPAESASSVSSAAGPVVERRLWAIAPLAVGVVGLGVGGFCLGQTSNYYNLLMNGTPSRLQADHYRDSGKTYQAVGWTVTAVGAAVAVASAVLIALPAQRSPAVSVAPLVGPGAAGVALSGALP